MCVREKSLVSELFSIGEMCGLCKMGRGRKGLLDQSQKKAKATWGLKGRRGCPGAHIFAPKREEKKLLIDEDALEFMKNMDQKELTNILLSGDTDFSCDGPENIGDFIPAPTCDPDQQIMKYLFFELCDQIGEDGEVREILEAASDFSKQKNCCAAMKLGEYLCCGEPCESMFCNKHLQQIKIQGATARPCRGCGIGTRGEYCCPCILETAKRERSRRLAKEFEDDEPPIGSYDWHAKKSAAN